MPSSSESTEEDVPPQYPRGRGRPPLRKRRRVRRNRRKQAFDRAIAASILLAKQTKRPRRTFNTQPDDDGGDSTESRYY